MSAAAEAGCRKRGTSDAVLCDLPHANSKDVKTPKLQEGFTYPQSVKRLVGLQSPQQSYKALVGDPVVRNP